MTPENTQYGIRDGKNIDLDIEHITGLIVDRDYSDLLLDDAFWVVLSTYYPDTVRRYMSKHEPTPVKELVSIETEAERLIRKLGYELKVVTPDDSAFPLDLFSWFDGVKFAASIRVDPFGWTDFVPGVSVGHATVLSLMQGARQLSELNLNRHPSQGTH